MSKKKILVIGSNSFSGSWFVDLLLSKNYKVFGVSRSKEYHSKFLKYKKNQNKKNFSFHKKNLNIDKDIEYIKKLILKNKIQYIVNFASQGMVAESWNRPLDWYSTNTMGIIKLVEEMKKCNLKRFLHISTPEVYGNFGSSKKESFIYNPTTPYAISRAAADTHILKQFEHFNFPAIFTRAANVFGPHQQLYRIVPKSIFFILKNKKIPIHGKGNSKRSFIYIADVVKAYYKILTKGKPGNCYHVSTNQYISINNLVKKICKNMNVDFIKYTKRTRDRVGKDKNYILNFNKIKKDLNWNFENTLDLGIEETIIWLKKNIKNFKLSDSRYKHKK